MKGKKRISALGVCLLFIYASFSLAQEPNPTDSDNLNLKNAILIAFTNNKDIQIQEQEIIVSRANIVDARSRFLPMINLEGSFTRRDKVPTPHNIFTGYKKDNYAALTLTESVYNGGADIANYKQAKLGVDIAQETLRAKKLDVEFDAKRLFYGLLLAYESERIAREALDQAKAHFDNVKQLFDQGRVSRFDVLQSQVQVSLLVPDLVNAQNEIDSIKAEFNKLLSLKIDTPINTNEKLPYEKIEIREDEFLKTAYLDKPEVKLSLLDVDISNWSISMAKSGYRPQIDITGDYSYRSDHRTDMLNKKHRNWNIGLGVTIPIFEGFSTKAKVDEAKARYAQTVLTKDNLYDQIAVDIKNACLDLKRSQTIINSQQDNVEQAREALRIANVSYANGVATNLDVLDSETSLSTIQKNLAAAIYDYLMAQAQLDRTMGKQYVKEEVK